VRLNRLGGLSLLLFVGVGLLVKLNIVLSGTNLGLEVLDYPPLGSQVVTEKNTLTAPRFGFRIDSLVGVEVEPLAAECNEGKRVGRLWLPARYRLVKPCGAVLGSVVHVNCGLDRVHPHAGGHSGVKQDATHLL
jgi:hypothetical protein